MHHDLVSAADCGGSNAHTGRAHTPVCLSCASADADAKSLEYKQQTPMSPAPQPAAQDGDGLSSSTHQWCIRKKVATFLCNMSTKPTRAPAEIGAAPAPCRRNRPVLYPAEMGVPRHRAAASGAGCDLRSQGLARGYGDQQRLCRQLLGWPWVMGLRAGYFHTDVGK